MRLFHRFVAAIALSNVVTSLLAAAPAVAAERITNDPKLTAAIVRDASLQARCGGCIRSVAWIGGSYPRVTVDAAAWKRTGAAARREIAARALDAASAVYLDEWSGADIYLHVFVVDGRGTALYSYQP